MLPLSSVRGFARPQQVRGSMPQRVAGAGGAGITYPDGWKAWVETAIDRPTMAVTVRLLRPSPCMVLLGPLEPAALRPSLPEPHP